MVQYLSISNVYVYTILQYCLNSLINKKIIIDLPLNFVLMKQPIRNSNLIINA